MMGKSVEACLGRHAEETPDKIAVIAGGKEVSYGRLFELVQGYASFLRQTGIQKGDVVVVKSSQTLDYAVAYLGIHLAGGVVTSLERSTPLARIEAVAQAVGARMVISDHRPELPDGTTAWADSREILGKAQGAEVLPLSFQDEEDSADILFTTGTTGVSKGVEISQRALLASAENTRFGCEYREDTVVIVPGPLNHASAIRKLITTMVNGSTIYILNGMVNMKAFFDALDYPCRKISCCLPASAIRSIFMLSGDKIGEYADKIDFIESAGAPLPEPDKERLCRLLPHTRLYNLYGSSESATVCMYDYNRYPGKHGCVGKVMPKAKLLIVDDDRRPIQSSKERLGYLACAGEVNMKGYRNEPELTREVMSDGIVYTNDIGYIDEEGFVYIIGRKNDVINVGGMKVAPTEVEEMALSMEGIEDCICIPVPHPITGQALKLLVVMQEGIAFSPKAIASYLQGRLETYKVPAQYEKADQIARTYNGKLDRNAYRAS